MLTDTIIVGARSKLINKRIVNQFMRSFFQCKTPTALKESFEERFPSYKIVIDPEKVSLKHQKDMKLAPECSDKEEKQNE